MTTDYRSRLIERMREHLNSRPTRNDVLAIAVPVAELADIAIDTLVEGEGVPRLPNYDAELFAKRRWTQPITQEQAENGEGFASIAVDLAHREEEVVACFAIVDAEGDRHVVELSPQSAEELCLAGLAVAREAASS